MVNFKRNAKPIAAGQQQRKVKGFKAPKPPVALGGAVHRMPNGKMMAGRTHKKK